MRPWRLDDLFYILNAPAELQKGHIRVMAKPSQFNKPFGSFSVR